MKTVNRAYRVASGTRPPALEIRQDRLQIEYSDGSRTEIVYDTVVRTKGLDAVAIAIYTGGEFPQVLLRRCLRPSVTVVRSRLTTPGPEFRPDCHSLEVVAGVVEDRDCLEPTLLQVLRARAAAEILEEAGYQVAPEDIAYLGHGGFSSPGMSPEMIWYMAMDVTGLGHPEPAGGGSVLEVGGTNTWMDLDDAVDACVDGRIEDMKSEVVLRRLRDQLQEEAKFSAIALETYSRDSECSFRPLAVSCDQFSTEGTETGRLARSSVDSLGRLDRTNPAGTGWCANGPLG